VAITNPLECGRFTRNVGSTGPVTASVLTLNHGVVVDAVKYGFGPPLGDVWYSMCGIRGHVYL
jgi:hypothetical protein